MRYLVRLGQSAAIVTFVCSGNVGPTLTIDDMLDWQRAEILAMVPRATATK